MTEQEIAPQAEFDYGQLSGDGWKFVQDARDEIRRLGKQTIESICEIGRLLTEVKARLPHGQWLPWLAAEFAWSERTAQRFMDSQGLIKSANLSDLPRLLELPPSSIADLGARSTPEAARQEVLQQVAAGRTPTTSEVKETIHRHKVDRARASVDQLHIEPVTSITAPTIRTESTAKELAYRGATEYRRAVAQGNARRSLEARDSTTGFGSTGQNSLSRDSKPKDHRPGIAHTVMNLNVGWTWEAVKSFAEMMDENQRKMLIDHLGNLLEKLHYIRNVLGTSEPTLSTPDERQLDIQDMCTEPTPEELSEELADEMPRPNGEPRYDYAEDPVELGRRVRDARKARNWTQGELAAAAGTHGPIISQIEKGKLGKVGKATLQRVTDAVL